MLALSKKRLTEFQTCEKILWSLKTSPSIPKVGSLAGKRDVHSLRAYATEESLQAKFPRKGAHELDLILLYPILDLLGNQTLNCSEYVSF